MSPPINDKNPKGDLTLEVLFLFAHEAEKPSYINNLFHRVTVMLKDFDSKGEYNII